MAEAAAISSLPILVADDLCVTIPGASVRLTPSDAFDLAEALMRKGYRRCIAEEAVAASKPQHEAETSR